MSNTFTVAFKKTFAPFRLKTIGKYNKQPQINILDVGCGNDSCKLTKTWLPISQYHGVDKEFWHGNAEDYKDMDKVFYFDLENELDKSSEIPDNFYDVIILSHIIEHVKNGYEVIEALIPKLKVEGIMYIEAPHPRTLGYPPAEGFFNFHDEPTHRMIYDPYNVSRVLLKHDFQIIRAKTRRDWLRLVFFSPIALLINLYYLPVKRKLFVTGLWDLFGVAFFVVAKKQKL